MRSPASGVPSATHTWPAWIESPIPTPPPWWMRDPRGAAGDVDQRVEQRPVGHRVRAVAHGLGLALGRGDRAGVEVVAPDDDRRAQLAAGHHLVEAQPGAVALAVAEPADARGQPLELHALARQRDPARDVLLVAEELEDRVVGGVRCRRGRRRAPPSGTGPCPRRTAGGCRRARSRDRRTRRRRRGRRRARAGRCRSRRPRRRPPAAARIAATCATRALADAAQVVVGVRARAGRRPARRSARRGRSR